MKNYLVDENGYYGEFGGAFVPEVLHRCVDELRQSYLGIMDSGSFKEEYGRLLRDYVGRPSPLYHARRLSERYGCRIYLKREDLNHTGAHKINNAVGTIYHYVNDPRVQIVLAEAGGKGVETGMTAATIAAGRPGIIHGALTYVMQNEDGQIVEPYSISAGLDYPGIGPFHANIAKDKRATVLAVNDDEALEAAFMLTRTEGIIPALESAHAIAALEKLKFRPDDVAVVTRQREQPLVHLPVPCGLGRDKPRYGSPAFP